MRVEASRIVVTRCAGASLLAKTRVAGEQLKAEVLAAIRQEPGCEGVKEIVISEQSLYMSECAGRSNFDATYHRRNPGARASEPSGMN
jgi:hypothetical protein